jgi:hypothetical protein
MVQLAAAGRLLGSSLAKNAERKTIGKSRVYGKKIPFDGASQYTHACSRL